MPRVIELADPYVAALDETAAAIAAQGFDPHDEDSLANAARWLRRLGNNPDFLGDLLIEQLAQRHREELPGNAYSPQVVMLVPPGGSFFMRANIWPSADEHMVRAMIVPDCRACPRPCLARLISATKNVNWSFC